MTTIAWITSLVVAIYLGRWIENRKTSAYWSQWYTDKLETFSKGQVKARIQFEQELKDSKIAWMKTVVHAYNAGLKEAKEKESA
jgi:ribosomal protein L7/L12